MRKNWNDFPFAPRRVPFFHGWLVLAAATLATIASIPGQTMGIGVFTEYMMVAFGLTSVQLSFAYMLGTIGSSLMMPLAGQLLDRWGARVMAALSSFGLGASLVVLAMADRAANVLFPGAFLAAMLASSIAFFFVRFTGQGCLTMVARVAIGKWFNYRRGFAAAVSGFFVSIGFNAGPFALNALVAALGWREALLALALGVGAGMTFAGWLLFRDNPEDCGLAMDGITDPEKLKALSKRAPETKREFTRAQALRTRAFWVFSLLLAWQGLLITAVVFHLTALGAEHGLTRTQAYAVFLPMPLVSVTANFAGGWMSDRYRLKYLLFIMAAGQLLGTLGLMHFGGVAGRIGMIAGLGVSGGLFGVILTVAWPRFFGRLHLGAISGLNMSLVVFASALGPLMFSIVQARTQSFHQALALCLAMPILIALLGIRTESPRENAA